MRLSSGERRLTVSKDYYVELSGAKVAPVAAPYETGIITQAGATRPFLVEREWSGPAGHYNEQWSIRQGNKVLHTCDVKLRFIKGFQSASRYVDVVDLPLEIAPGSYSLVFVVEGRFMGAADIEVRDSPTAA
ncbi:MAG: hypothetical protein ABIS18_05575 [Actinomycetota bacterium]